MSRSGGGSSMSEPAGNFDRSELDDEIPF
jgi:hypothetical protein